MTVQVAEPVTQMTADFQALIEGLQAEGVGPDYEMREKIVNVLKQHRPQFKKADARVSCICGWAYYGPSTNKTNTPNWRRYQRHVATAIELTLTRWFTDEDKAAAA